jgi:S-adenosylmethionine:tRNA ribosyltransferase-isomerase
MKLSDFNYDLPEELIAQTALDDRESSRMLLVSREDGNWKDSRFSELVSLIRPGDLLVVNNSRVFPARLKGTREPTKGSVELLMLSEIEKDEWEVLARPARRVNRGDLITFGRSLIAEVVEIGENGKRRVRFNYEGDLQSILEEIGETPLPPYIKREKEKIVSDRERYQTVYAAKTGSIAAPTAGLHFTDGILERIKERGAKVAEITLHVGYGTFEPVRVENIEEHKVLPERFHISERASDLINSTKKGGGRIIAVGTTTVRALESNVNREGLVLPGNSVAQLTIRPGYKFEIVDSLLTNFHLPCSSLLLLVAAFAGRDLVLKAYKHAVSNRYRFYSYGDCMLII